MTAPRTFELVRYRDPSGVSGTGVVAEGCLFTDGSVALRWRGENPATCAVPASGEPGVPAGPSTIG